MAKDRLYLLKPDFELDGHRQFCSECAMVEGMLSFFPKVRAALDVHYIQFQRPRPQIVAELGPDHQSSPCLVVADPAAAKAKASHVTLQQANGRHFVNDPLQVCEYLAQMHGTPRPHA